MSLSELLVRSWSLPAKQSDVLRMSGIAFLMWLNAMIFVISFLSKSKVHRAAQQSVQRPDGILRVLQAVSKP